MADSTSTMTSDLTPTLPSWITTLSEALGCTQVKHIDQRPELFELYWQDPALLYLQVEVYASTISLDLYAQDMDYIRHSASWAWSFEMSLGDDLSDAIDFVRSWIREAHASLAPAVLLHQHLITHFPHEIDEAKRHTASTP